MAARRILTMSYGRLKTTLTYDRLFRLKQALGLERHGKDPHQYSSSFRLPSNKNPAKVGLFRETEGVRYFEHAKGYGVALRSNGAWRHCDKDGTRIGKGQISEGRGHGPVSLEKHLIEFHSDKDLKLRSRVAKKAGLDSTIADATAMVEKILARIDRTGRIRTGE